MCVSCRHSRAAHRSSARCRPFPVDERRPISWAAAEKRDSRAPPRRTRLARRRTSTTCRDQEAIVGHDGHVGSAEQEAGPAGVNVNIPHSARIYDYWLGGKDNFAVDRQVADAMIAAIPQLRAMAAENRRFVHRVARHLVEKEGIRQFLDIGTGIPTSPNLHEVAQGIAPETRVVYVDN